MLLPVVSYFLPADPATESQIRLMEELAKSKETTQEDASSEEQENLKDIPETWEGPYVVANVHAGDFLDVEFNDELVAVNLLGIEAPKLQDSESEDEKEAGNKAHTYMQELLVNTKIYLEYDENEPSEDGVLRAFVYTEDGTMVNEAILRAGYAKVSSSLPEEQTELFHDAEENAKSAEAGLWADYWK